MTDLIWKDKLGNVVKVAKQYDHRATNLCLERKRSNRHCSSDDLNLNWYVQQWFENLHHLFLKVNTFFFNL